MCDDKRMRGYNNTRAKELYTSDMYCDDSKFGGTCGILSNVLSMLLYPLLCARD